MRPRICQISKCVTSIHPTQQITFRQKKISEMNQMRIKMHAPTNILFQIQLDVGF